MKPEVQAAWVQAVGSVAAIFTAIWISARQLRNTENLQKTLVRPHLVFTQFVYSDPCSFKIEVRNAGLGPAVILSFQVFVDGKEAVVGEHGWVAVLAGLDWPGGRASGTWLQPKTAIQAGAEIEVAQVVFLDGQISAPQMNAQIRRIEIRVLYESVFSERFIATMRD